MAKNNRIPKSLQRAVEAKLAESNVKVNSIWTPVKMKPVNPKRIVTERYHHGRMVGGLTEPAPQCFRSNCLKYEVIEPIERHRG